MGKKKFNRQKQQGGAAASALAQELMCQMVVDSESAFSSALEFPEEGVKAVTMVPKHQVLLEGLPSRAVPASERGYFCQPEMRDPMAVILSFVADPTEFRRTCTFLVECYFHSIYLEVFRPCPFVSLVQVATPATADPDGGHGEHGFHPDDEYGGGATATVATTMWSVIPMPLKMDLRVALGWDTLIIFDLENALILSLKKSSAMHQYPKELCPMPALPPCIFHMSQVVTSDRTALNFYDFVLPQSTTELKMNHVVHVTSFGKRLFQGHWNLTSVVLADLPDLESIATCCFADCSVLRTFSLTDAPQLLSIGNAFLKDCGSLEEVTLHNLPSLVHLGDDCFAQCENLWHVTLTGLPNLQGYSCEDKKIFRGSGNLEVVITDVLLETTEQQEDWKKVWPLDHHGALAKVGGVFDCEGVHLIVSEEKWRDHACSTLDYIVYGNRCTRFKVEVEGEEDEEGDPRDQPERGAYEYVPRSRDGVPLVVRWVRGAVSTTGKRFSEKHFLKGEYEDHFEDTDSVTSYC